jgi:DNA-binding XRE family transcriptional regulator
MMAIAVDDVLKKLSRKERNAIEARRQELLAEYMTLQDLRKARELTQQRMAELLGIKQANVSRIEKRSDLLLSTLGSYVAAMGGRLRLVAEFPDRPPVVLSKLSGESEVRPDNRATG